MTCTYYENYLSLGSETTTSDGEDSDEDSDDSNDSETLRRGLTATDLYDLTLTAIAFLGFGTFVMNLVMDAMSVRIGRIVYR